MRVMIIPCDAERVMPTRHSRSREALAMAIYMAAAPSVMYATHALDPYGQLQVKM
jgi:hypothetical protein